MKNNLVILFFVIAVIALVVPFISTCVSVGKEASLDNFNKQIHDGLYIEEVLGVFKIKEETKINGHLVTNIRYETNSITLNIVKK